MSSVVGVYGMNSNWGADGPAWDDMLVRELWPKLLGLDEHDDPGVSRQQPPGRPQDFRLFSPSASGEILDALGRHRSDVRNGSCRSCWMNVLAASKMGLYPVHRQRFPSRWPFISMSSSHRVNSRVSGSKAFRMRAYSDMTMPGVQNPHLHYQRLSLFHLRRRHTAKHATCPTALVRDGDGRHRPVLPR
jgi:hypothetical protein